jgi:ankyrin repeat protein
MEDNPGSSLLDAFVEGNSEVIFAKLKSHRDLDVNRPLNEYPYNQMPLHLATEKGHFELVKYLIEERKANVEIRDHDRWTPLMYSVFYNHPIIYEYLVKKCRAKLNSVDSNGQTALFIAAEKGVSNACHFLVSQGAKVNIADRDTCDTALSVASTNNHVDICELLISAGADVNVCGDSQTTPLMFAASRGQTDLVCTLLELGADLRIHDLNPNYKTAFLYAAGGAWGTIRRKVTCSINHRLF